MGRAAFEASAAARSVFEAADDALGFALSRICFEAPESELLRTEIQQPAILTTSIALLRALEEQARFEVAFVAGHSLGEYSALVAAGALGFEDAVRLVHARGRYMQEAVPEGLGAMAAVIACPLAELERACAEAQAETGRVVSVANLNAPQQLVIAGDARAVEVACRLARAAGARRTLPLPVSAPFHCALMQPAAEKLAPELAALCFSEPRPPLVSNVEARPTTEAARLPELLRIQITAPVRFTEMIQELERQGVDHVLEVGPGRVLSGLVARIAPGLARASLGDLSDLEATRAFVAGGGARGGPPAEVPR